MKKIVLYVREIAVIGGIETFMYNFCVHMHNDYDITILNPKIPQNQLDRFRTVVKVVTDMNQQLECDTLIMLRMTDKVPSNVKYKKMIRRLHSTKYYDIQEYPTDGDVTVCVSEMVKDTFGVKDGVVINNLTYKTAKPTLLLMSATRMPAPDKGDNLQRMRKLGKMLDEAQIPYMWLNFSNNEMEDKPKMFYNMGFNLSVQNYMQKADYIVQLSTVEACSNTVLEALTLNKPLICTPVPSFFELGVVDGVNAHVVPFDMNFDVHKLLDIPKYMFTYDNDKRIKQWKEIL